MEKYYTIGQLSQIIGVTVKTLRRWEQSGKLVPDVRTAGNHRREPLDSYTRILRKTITTR